MKFAVLVFPGSNCDRDMYNAAIKSGVDAAYVDYRETTLDGFDGVLIPGGFHLGLFEIGSYGKCCSDY